MGIALIGQSKIIILDEPTTGMVCMYNQDQQQDGQSRFKFMGVSLGR